MDDLDLDELVKKPLLLKEALDACATLPIKGFKFKSKPVGERKRITYEVTMKGISIVAQDFDDSMARDLESWPDGQDGLRKAMRRLDLPYLGYLDDYLYEFHAADEI